MGKVVTIYLTDEETTGLRKFCEENACSQYAAIKTGLRELLSRPLPKETATEIQEKTKAETAPEKPKPSIIRSIIRRLNAEETA